MKWTAALAAVTLCITASAQLRPAREPVEASANQRTYVYKTTAEGDLKVNVYLPEGWKASDKRPALLLFFGGGFTGGSPEQFRTKAEYLAGRGMVALTPEYRVKTRHSTNPDKSIEDAKSAIRWVRSNTKELGVDENRVAAGGGSAGATCAALAALSAEFEPVGEDTRISSKPNALVLYNPAVILPGKDLERPRGPEMTKVLGAWKVRQGDPPMILFFGTDDQLLAASREMARQSAEAGNRAEFYTAAGQKHGFFNDATITRNGSPGWHEVVLRQTDLFLASLGYLKGAPTVKTPDSGLRLQKDQFRPDVSSGRKP